MYQAISYIKFLLKSTNQHGVHSPFVYDFVTKCLYNKYHYSEYKKLQNFREYLLDSKTVLKIFDLGEGSKRLKEKQRKVNQMASMSSSSKKKMRLLYRVSKYFECHTILELGTSLGMGTYALALSNENSEVTTIEGCPNTSDFTKQIFSALGLENTKFIKGDFTNIIPTLKTDTFDLVFFDGHHNKAATINYFESLLHKIDNNTVFVFDDIYWSKGMTEAWEYIKAHEIVTVTVDCFHLGFVFFRIEQAKEHFKIRL